MNILSFVSENPVLQFGCGCNKNTGGGSLTATRRVTVYEVQVNGSTVSEFETLPAARSMAVELGGRVKVSSKVVPG